MLFPHHQSSEVWCHPWVAKRALRNGPKAEIQPWTVKGHGNQGEIIIIWNCQGCQVVTVGRLSNRFTIWSKYVRGNSLESFRNLLAVWFVLFWLSISTELSHVPYIPICQSNQHWHSHKLNSWITIQPPRSVPATEVSVRLGRGGGRQPTKIDWSHLISPPSNTHRTTATLSDPNCPPTHKSCTKLRSGGEFPT